MGRAIITRLLNEGPLKPSAVWTQGVLCHESQYTVTNIAEPIKKSICGLLRNHTYKGYAQIRAKYTVRVCKLLLTNCVQAHDDCLEVFPHINPYLSTRRPRSWVSKSRTSQFFEIPYLQEFCPEHIELPAKLVDYFVRSNKSNTNLSRLRIFSKNGQEFIQTNLRGPPPYWAAPFPPTKVGAKCLDAVVLAHSDRVLSLRTYMIYIYF